MQCPIDDSMMVFIANAFAQQSVLHCAILQIGYSLLRKSLYVSSEYAVFHKIVF